MPKPTTQANKSQTANAKRPSAKATPSADWDSPWKEIIELLLRFFLIFFAPDLALMIDWSRPYRFLDKEFQKITQDAATGRRYVDKLLSVYLKEGRQIWILIHIEIQSEVEAAFPYRMFVYHARIADKYGRLVISMAILTEEDPNWRPDHYEQSIWRTKVRLDFPIIKLIDYRERWEELEQSDNPFALVVMAHLKALETKQNAEARYHWKWELIQLMHQKGYTQEIILQMYRFLDWLMALPEEASRRFDQELSVWEEERKMTYIMGAERRGIEKGQQEMLLEMLRIKFLEIPAEVTEQVKKLDQATLKQMVARVMTAQTLSEIGLGNSNGAHSNP